MILMDTMSLAAIAFFSRSVPQYSGDKSWFTLDFHSARQNSQVSFHHHSKLIIARVQ